MPDHNNFSAVGASADNLSIALRFGYETTVASSDSTITQNKSLRNVLSTVKNNSSVVGVVINALLQTMQFHRKAFFPDIGLSCGKYTEATFKALLFVAEFCCPNLSGIFPVRYAAMQPDFPIFNKPKPFFTGGESEIH